METNLIHSAVNEILKNANVSFSAVYIGENENDAFDQHDEWRLYLETHKKYEFVFRTGLGLRAEPTAAQKQRARMGFPGLTEKDIANRTIYGRKYLRALEEQRKPKAPEVADLIYSLLSDAEACTQSFSDWCSSFGYNNDSMKANETYRACQENGDKFNRIFNRTFAEQLREALQDY